MKSGDKIVCINSGNFRTYRGECKDAVYKIRDNQIYTISKNELGIGIKLQEIPNTFYHWERFIELEKCRSLKLKQIISKINE